ncbi:MAG: hypothetical protein JSV34_04825 [Candidatus Omnitrophota bacterium]|nr:MAG: hypothetical protein JSV34_04825 [Candidatus Omnitrophota bacterium]
MSKKNLFFSVALSFLIHFFVIFSFSPYFSIRKTPVIYCWSSILKKEDLFVRSGRVDFPKGVDFSFGGLREKYFSSGWQNRKNFYQGVNKNDYPSSPRANSKNYLKESRDYLYLWKRRRVFPSKEKEKIPYKVLCSASGKVIFLYPQKLSLDSKKNIAVQKYIREAVFPLKDKFFWTKLEGVIE